MRFTELAMGTLESLGSLKFMEYGLQDTTQGCVLGRDDTCVGQPFRAGALRCA